MAKTYVKNLFLTHRKFDNGGEILTLSIPLKKFVAEMQNHVNPSGYVKITITELLKKREYNGQQITHTAYIYEKDDADTTPKKEEELESPF